MTTHINTIVDYSLLWALSVKEHFDAYGDLAFLEQIYPKMQSLMEFCERFTDEHGFLVARSGDWTFIDWADLDKDDPFGAVQMLLAACWGAMDWLSEALGRDGTLYRQRRMELLRNIDTYYWDDEQGAYLDSFSSGRRHITRQTNIFAVLFHIANPARRERILKKIIDCDTFPPHYNALFQFLRAGYAG
jgi:glycogen debranching enzyme